MTRGYHVAQIRKRSSCGVTSNSRRQTTGTSTSLSSSSSPLSAAQHSLADDISPTRSGTISFLGGWFHSIGLDIYVSPLVVAPHFVTNDIQGEKEERLYGCTLDQLCWSMEGKKRRNWSTSAVQDRKKQRETKMGGGGGWCPCARMYTAVSVCVCVCVCVLARTSAGVIKKRKFQTKYQPQQAIPALLPGSRLFLPYTFRLAESSETWEKRALFSQVSDEAARRNIRQKRSISVTKNSTLLEYFKEVAASTMQRKIQHEKEASFFFFQSVMPSLQKKKERAAIY